MAQQKHKNKTWNLNKKMIQRVMQLQKKFILKLSNLYSTKNDENDANIKLKEFKSKIQHKNKKKICTKFILKRVIFYKNNLIEKKVNKTEKQNTTHISFHWE